MNKIYLLLVGLLFLYSCHDVKVGYLRTGNAEYSEDSLIVRKTLKVLPGLPPVDEFGDPIYDPEDIDRKRVENDAPWVSLKISGVLGTPPINYEFVGVKCTDGGDAALFKQEINVRGAGVLELPLYTKLPAACYTVTIRVFNEDHSAVLDDIYTFIVEN